MFRRIFTIIVLISLVGTVALAQTTGKIIGKVVDKQTGEPLVGVNVIIVGTSFGAATDINGEYIINQISPGTVTLRASYIGYQEMLIENVRIIAGLTQTENFQLLPTTIATKEVVVISQRPLIQKSATNAVRIVSSDDIQSLPIRNVAGIIALQAGVVQQNGLTFIRGSRPDETGYILEGADIKNILNRNGGSLITVSPDALQEILVQAGGYTAEYGNANAGIIQEDFKTGTDKYHFSLRMETDNFGNANTSDRFLGTYSYGYSDYSITASGPLFSDKLKIFLAGENNFVRDYSPQFLYGNPQYFSNGLPWSTTYLHDDGLYGGNKNDSAIVAWKAGSIPGRMQNSYTFNGTALLDEKPLLIRLASAFTWRRTRMNDNADGNIASIPYVYDLANIYDIARLPLLDQSNFLLNLKGTYFISSNSYVEANVNFLDNRSKQYDPYFGDNVLAYSDSLQVAQYGWTYKDFTTSPPAYDFSGFPFIRPGTQLSNYAKARRNYIGASVAYTTEFGRNEIKAGASYQRWTVRNYGVGTLGSLLLNTLQNPDFARNTDSLIFLFENQGYRGFNNYGFDLFGNSVDSGPFAPKHPVFSSGYIEDRVELNDLIINAGLRYDYINMDSWAWRNPALPTYNSKNHLIPDSSLQKGSTFNYLSPRLGFSFPVTDRTVFHLQYGKFVQSPSLDVAYRGMLVATTQLTGTNLFVNPIAYNPEPIRTTQYEIGFTQQFTEFAALDITTFYKDIKGQLQYAEILTAPGAPKSKYAAFINQDFSTTKGIELSLKIRRVERVQAEFDYTYSDAQGTNSFSGSGIGSVEVNNNVPTVLLPLIYNQTHRGTLMLDYRFGKDDGGPILQQLGINVLFTFNSGHPYTLAAGIDQTGLGQTAAYTGGLIDQNDTRARRTTGPVNQATTPWDYNFDLRIDKTVNIYDFDVNFYVYVQNLLNTKNVINVYDRTGNAYSDGFLESNTASGLSQTFKDFYGALNTSNRQAALAVMGVDMFGTPRQLRAGVLINF
jgi:hypothetical protein